MQQGWVKAVYVLSLNSTLSMFSSSKYPRWSFQLLAAEMFLVSNSFIFIASIHQIKRRLWGQRGTVGKISPENLSNISKTHTPRPDNEKGYLSSWLVPGPSMERVEAGPGWPLYQPVVAGPPHAISLVKGGLQREGTGVGPWPWNCHSPSRTTTGNNSRWKDWFQVSTGVHDWASSQGKSNHVAHGAVSIGLRSNLKQSSVC